MALVGSHRKPPAVPGPPGCPNASYIRKEQVKARDEHA
jgi:hypothetical protein